MDKIWQWFNVNGLWLGLFSLITFVASLLIIPVIVTRIPADYFVDRQRHLSRLKRLHPVVYIALLVLKNLFGEQHSFFSHDPIKMGDIADHIVQRLHFTGDNRQFC